MSCFYVFKNVSELISLIMGEKKEA